MDNVIVAQNLKDLREKNRLSHKRLSEELGKCGIIVSDKMLMNYESAAKILKDGSEHSKANTIGGMKLETAAGIAKYFGVSLDYFVGNTENPVIDTKVRAICEYTGLRSESVAALKMFKDTDAIEALNYFLSDKTYKFLITLQECLINYRGYFNEALTLLTIPEYKSIDNPSCSTSQSSDNNAEFEQIRNILIDNEIKSDERIDLAYLQIQKFLKCVEQLISSFLPEKESDILSQRNLFYEKASEINKEIFSCKLKSNQDIANGGDNE